MRDRIIAVLGVTGTQGGSVARTFVHIPGWKVRGITRNKTSSASRELERLGVELVEANLDNVESLAKAFSGVNAIFAVTDFWQFPQDPKTHELVAAKGITWNEACYELEYQQGVNLLDAAARRANDSDFDRLIVSSLSGARQSSQGKYNWVYHFDSKAQYVQYLKIKAQTSPDHRDLLDKTSYVQIGNYLDNWKMNPILKPYKRDDGYFVWRRIATEAGTIHPMPFVHPPTDAGPFVEALVLRAPPRTTMLGTSAVMHFSQYVDLWGKLCGVPATTEDVTLEQMDAFFPGGFGREVGETMAYVSEYGWDGGEGALLPADVGVDLKALTTPESYIKNMDWSSVLG